MPATSTLVRFLPPAAVQLREGADLAAQRTVRETLLRLDPDRLLAPYLREAGLSARAEPYPGWESDGLDGHTAGHVLSAASTLAARGDDAPIAALVEHLVGGMRDAQQAIGTGYVGGVPDGVALWEEVLSGRVEAGAFSLNGRWVPLYNLHKTLAGLLDATELVGHPVADAALADLGHWWLRTAAALDDGVFGALLDSEFGGFTEAFARLAILRRDPALLALARRFARPAFVEPLVAGRDELDGLHANTLIPVAVGLATIERAAREVDPDAVADVAAREGAAARTFFDTVAGRRSIPLGGDSVAEHFHAAEDFSRMFVAREGPETCNTHNMVKLAAELHALTGDDAYLHWAERARLNHLRSAQHPGHGGLVYFTSQRPGHYRVYSPEAEGFWCCMGSGFEAQARHGALVYAESAGTDAAPGELRINALVPSSVRTRDLLVEIDPAEAAAGVDAWRVTVTADRPLARAVSILIPDGVEHARIETAPGVVADVAAGTRWTAGTTWSGRTTYRIELPRRLRVETAPDGSAWGWVVDGSEVLAQRIPDEALSYRGTGARMGHIALGALRPLAEAPILDPADVAAAERLADGRVRVAALEGAAIDLEPFAGIHDARYTVAFPLADAATAAARRVELAGIDAEALDLEARTCDAVVFGQQQPESDHALVADDEDTGIVGDVRWRRTAGAIRFTLRDWTGTADRLRVEWFPAEEPGGLRVHAGGAVVLDRTLTPESTETVCEVDMPASPGALEWSMIIEPTGSMIDRVVRTPRLRGVRLLTSVADR
ncbi:glycoside hydrolase family 127 protein [Microbacterium sp. ARD31]|uniref:beta-L-arabinofuranosidase domain-containing protein n=1 Tax=Microbacterium sp. ARD31 TaxID=2962576 RepID=UPI00288132FD|nr:beta-L-arabinofuranosidase domain-containing protein [Microbacterium sp. ARD31]MDT0181784.1 glycoside hydrolase family 127 protein [Microbacterium sp. ARD31]